MPPFAQTLVVELVILWVQPPELEDMGREQNKITIIQEEMLSDLLYQLDTQKSMRLDGIHPRLLSDLILLCSPEKQVTG